MKEKYPLFRKADLLLAAALLLAVGLSLFFLFSGGKTGETAVVYLDGERYAALPLSEDAELEIVTDRGRNLVVVENGKVFVKEADCPDLVCVHTPALSEGDPKTIACLPHRLVILLEGGDGA